MKATLGVLVMFPVLLKPRVSAFKNRWKGSSLTRAQIGRDFVVLFFSITIMLGIYSGTLSLLNSLNVMGNPSMLPPALPLALLLMFLFVLLAFSNGITALGSLFLAKDLEFILSSPISPINLFSGKALDILLHSSWMVIVFGIPFLAAFGSFYEATPFFYLAVVLTALPFFAIPAALGIIIVTLFSSAISATRAREVLFAFFAIALGSFYFAYKLLQPPIGEVQQVSQVLQLFTILSLPDSLLTPSYWVAVCLSELLVPSGKSITPYIILLVSAAISLLSIGYIFLRLLYPRAYAKAKATSQGLRINSKLAQRNLKLCTFFLPIPVRGILGKELKLFARDMTHAVQLILLLGICMIYLYNFRAFRSFDSLPPNALVWWKSLLVLLNLIMGSFVLTAISARFIYPSLSLEGKSYWILQCSPISIHSYLKAKFICWYIPTALISSIVFLSGALAIRADLPIIIICASAGLILSYGLVSLAIGFGAYFIDLDWEHASQITTGFGSLLFMIGAMVLAFANIIVTGLLILLQALYSIHPGFTAAHWYGVVAGCFALLLYLNHAVARYSFFKGEKALRCK